MKHNIRQQSGFSLVELITVLVLLGIISAVAFARLGNVASFSESLFQQQVLSYLRLAQRTAVAHQGSGAQLNINRVSASEWDITLQFATQTLSYQLEGDNALTFASGASTGSISAGDTLSLVYRDNGDLAELTSPLVADVDTSLSLIVADRSICVSPTGFAYEGLCL